MNRVFCFCLAMASAIGATPAIHAAEPHVSREVSEQQPRLRQEGANHLLKFGADTVGRIWYPAHEKTLLGVGWQPIAKEGLKNLAKDGLQTKSNPRLPEKIAGTSGQRQPKVRAQQRKMIRFLPDSAIRACPLFHQPSTSRSGWCCIP